VQGEHGAPVSQRQVIGNRLSSLFRYLSLPFSLFFHVCSLFPSRFFFPLSHYIIPLWLLPLVLRLVFLNVLTLSNESAPSRVQALRCAHSFLGRAGASPISSSIVFADVSRLGTRKEKSLPFRGLVHKWFSVHSVKGCK